MALTFSKNVRGFYTIVLAHDHVFMHVQIYMKAHSEIINAVILGCAGCGLCFGFMCPTAEGCYWSRCPPPLMSLSRECVWI